MKKFIDKKLSLGESVIIYPALIERYNEMQLDYCCGGSESLESAFAKKNIDVDKFVDEINKEVDNFKFEESEFIDWTTKSSKELINHINNTHHVKTFTLLKEIDPLMTKVFRVHFAHLPEVLTTVHKLFGTLKCEIEEHLVKEEEVLFPLMLKYENAKDESEKEELLENIKLITSEHEAAGDILKELEEVTNDYKAPEWACTSFKILYQKLNELEKDLFVHIHKENNILFKRYQ